eukprot:jgi/Bigna1/82893/fgenesh1_pg.99_\
MSTKEQARKASECHRQKMLKKTMCQQRKQQRAILREMKRKEREKEAVEKESQRRLARANLKRLAMSVWDELVNIHDGEMKRLGLESLKVLHKYFFKKNPSGKHKAMERLQKDVAGWDELMVDGIFPDIESHAAFKLKGSTFEIRRNRFEDPIPFTGEAKNWKEAIFYMARFVTHHTKMMPYGGFFRDGILNCDYHSDMDLDIRVPREVGRKTALGTLKSWGLGCGIEYVCQGKQKGRKLEEHTFRCSSDMHVFNVQLIDWNAFQEKDGKYNLDFTANAFCAMEGEMLLIPWRNPMVEEGQVIDDIRNKIMRPCKPVLGDELMEARAARFSRRGWTMMDYTWDLTGLHQIRDEGSTT